MVALTLLLGYNQFGAAILGKASGPSHFQHESFLQGLSAGGRDQFTITNTGVVTIGQNGSTISELKMTQCALTGMNASHTASTTRPYDCAVTGIASGDVTMAQFASSTPFSQTFNGWQIVGSKASTTAGYLTVLIANMTGATLVPSAVTQLGSSTNVWYGDN